MAKNIHRQPRRRVRQPAGDQSDPIFSSSYRRHQEPARPTNLDRDVSLSDTLAPDVSPSTALDGPAERGPTSLGQLHTLGDTESNPAQRSVLPNESHRKERIGWLRAAVLGANDGIISTSSLVVGVAAAGSSHSAIMLTAIAGLAAGTLSMASSEYVSVSSQADTEQADLSQERAKLAASPKAEHAELASLYVARGLTCELAIQVANQLMEHDALGANAQDKLGIQEATRARPIQAAGVSAASFAIGAVAPVVLAALLPAEVLTVTVVGSTLGLLLVLGGIAARVGDAPLTRGALRVAFWGAVAMGCTAAIGRLFGPVT